MNDKTDDSDFSDAEKQSGRDAIRRLQAIGTASLDRMAAKISEGLAKYDDDQLEQIAADICSGNFMTIDPSVLQNAAIEHILRESHRRIDERKHLLD